MVIELKVLGLVALGLAVPALAFVAARMLRRRRTALLTRMRESGAQELRQAQQARAFFANAYSFRREFGATAFRRQLVDRADPAVRDDLTWLDTAVTHGVQQALALEILVSDEPVHSVYKLFYVGGLPDAGARHSHVDLVYTRSGGLRLWSRARRGFVHTVRPQCLSLEIEPGLIDAIPYALVGVEESEGAPFRIAFRAAKRVIQYSDRTVFDEVAAREALAALQSWVDALPLAPVGEAVGTAIPAPTTSVGQAQGV